LRPTIAVVAVLLAFPLGFFLKARLTACVVYAIAYLWSFTFQTLYLLLAREGGDYSAFSEDPAFPLSYGLVTAGIFAVGFGLVWLGHRLGAKRLARASTAQ
jgi:hypothetical protein